MDGPVAEQSIVIDNGSLNMKAGYSGEDLPRNTFRCIVGHDNRPHHDEWFVSNHCDGKEEYLEMIRPISRGQIEDWDAMTRLWEYTFDHALEVRPDAADMPIVLTDNPLNAKANREQMAQIMFETFKAPAIYIANRAVLSLYASGRTRGLVVQAGAGVCHAVPVFEGYALPHAVMKLELGGFDLTNSINNILRARGHEFKGPTGLDIVRDIKAKHCCVPPASKSEAEVKYELPDGNVATLDTAELTAQAEALFRPEVMGEGHPAFSSPGLGVLAVDAINKCDADLQHDLYGAVVCAGGSSMLPGFCQRMQEEIAARAPAGTDVRVVPDLRPGQRRERGYNSQRENASWIGASMFATLPTFSQLKITKQEWEEQAGKSIIHNKCF